MPPVSTFMLLLSDRRDCSGAVLSNSAATLRIGMKGKAW
jgi:hypothetical protein